MADIELVIKIPEEEYRMILLSDKIAMEYRTSKEAMMYAIKNGTPLPKGHGRLIILSEDAVKESLELLSFSRQKWISEVGLSDATVGFIEADKGE